MSSLRAASSAVRKGVKGHMHRRTLSLTGSQHSMVRLAPSPSPSARSFTSGFMLSADPDQWGNSQNIPEEDDYLHNPDSRDDEKSSIWRTFTSRGIANLGCIALLLIALFSMFGIYPLIQHFRTVAELEALEDNFPQRAPLVEMPGRWSPIDPDTPKDVYVKKGIDDPNQDYELVFSDEFNIDGRTFYPGDDPYWEAEDLWGTQNLEWYDPVALITENGNLKITLSEADPARNHNLNYTGGLMSTWNKFCFTGGYLEANVSLPGSPEVQGLWPAIWTLGNLGRAGYGATLEGLWPYSYDTCDVGTVLNQTLNGGPRAALTTGDTRKGGYLSNLPGQRLSRCTCPGEDHPGPMHDDGTFVGRSAPEIDMFEAQVSDDHIGGVSQSCQFAPFNAFYSWKNVTYSHFYDPTISALNTYKGSDVQQASSGVTNVDQNCYEKSGGCFSIYGFEYKPGVDGAYITWIADNKPAWTLRSQGMGPDLDTQIGQRPIPQEPMYLIANLGISHNFGAIDFQRLTFPATLKIDYIRLYQPKGAKNIGCDPPGFPTTAYIAKHLPAYSNPELMNWGHAFPRNRWMGQCAA